MSPNAEIQRPRPLSSDLDLLLQSHLYIGFTPNELSQSFPHLLSLTVERPALSIIGTLCTEL